MPGGWKLVGKGTDIYGDPFALSQSVTVVGQAAAAGDFESATEWLDVCVGNTEILAAYQSLSAIAGTRSLHTSGCPRFRLSRAAAATELKLDAAVVDCASNCVLNIEVNAMAPEGSTVEVQRTLTSGQVQTLSVPLPAEDGDVLFTISASSDVWLDSLRTE
jgi:hypothetical protein